MNFNVILEELQISSANLDNDATDRRLLSSVYCNQACKVKFFSDLQLNWSWLGYC